MKRSPALVRLSHDHHHALEAALVLRHATPESVDEAVAAFGWFWELRGRRHFEVEEELVLPAIPDSDPGWRRLSHRVRVEHADVRTGFAALQAGSGESRVVLAHELGELLYHHVRFEERELFVQLETTLTDEQLSHLGERLQAAPDGQSAR